MKKFIICLALIVVLRVPAYASVVIGDWENGSADGWIDWIEYGTGLPITAAANGSKYSFSTFGATSGSSSLHVIQSGWSQNLAIKLQANGLVDEFMANSILAIDVTVPADTLGTGGWCEIYALSLNAATYGWQDLSPVVAYHWDYWDGSPQRTATVTWDYSAAKEKIPANPCYVEFIIATNSDGVHNDFYFDNARLIDSVQLVPEPATIAMLGLGSLALFYKGRKNKSAS